LAEHFVYRTIVKAIKSGKLEEPFTIKDLIKACPELNERTCHVFPPKHREGNPSGTSELFIEMTIKAYKLKKPIKYDL